MPSKLSLAIAGAVVAATPAWAHHSFAAQFDQLVKDLQQSLGLTVFMVTHDIDTLRATTDRIAVLVGKKIKVGTIKTLVTDKDPWIHEYFTGPRGRAALDA